MAEQVTLNVTSRTERGKGAARRLRREGRIPAVVYGPEQETQSISVDAGELDRLFTGITVENTLIDLQREGEEPVRTLVREVQSHPFKPQILHVDFYRVSAGREIRLDVPVRLVGTAEGEQEGGILEQLTNDLEVRCLPDAIPEAIDVNVEELDIGDSLHVADLALPEGVRVTAAGDRTVCSVVSPSVAALTVEPEEPEGVGGEVEPELIREGAEDEETPPATEQGGTEGDEE